MLLSPSPSPPSDEPHSTFASAQELDAMLAVSVHPQHPMHPSLLYSMDYRSSAPTALSLPPQSENDSPPPQGAQGKRYRSAPAKTFQCAGYGECRMVFSRSEHLARHIRKHTGERPFACHCTKQFSRLDNLRQHAQTVHSAPEDKPLNERMMRALAGVNASMMAGVRGRRRYGGDSPSSSTPSFSSSPLPSPPYSVPSSSSGAPSFPPGTFSSASMSMGSVSPPFASPALSDGYGSGYGGSPLPSPSFGSFPTGPSPYAQQQQQSSSSSSYQSSPASSYQHFPHRGSPFSSPSVFDAPGAQDYLAAGAVRVKQEEGDESLREREMELEGFYAALEGASSSSQHQHHQHGHGLASYPSSGSLSSLSSAHSTSSSSSADSERPDTARQGGQGRPRPAYLRSHSSASVGTSSSHNASTQRSAASSPAGSPCVAGFQWSAPAPSSRQQQQQQGGQQLPSPPQSPPYYSTQHSSHPGHQHQGQGEQLYGWLEDGTVGEMSNAQYYAALQSSQPMSSPPIHHGQGAGEYFSYAPPPPAHHSHGGHGQGGYAVYA